MNLKLLNTLAEQSGLKIASFCPVLTAEQESENLKKWQKKGFAGEMSFMNRDPELMLHPEKLFPEMKSIITLSLNYSAKTRASCPTGYAKVARYAWGKDYHKVIRKLMKKFVALISENIGKEVQYRAFSDSVPMLERFYASKSGLGFIGKNTLLIRPGEGSFFFLGEILSDLEIEGEPLPLVDNNCGNCKRCISNCPTEAIVEEYQVDARKCISYLTIEKRGILTAEESSMIGDWIFGCDICQEVCPFNHASLKSEREADRDEFEDLIIPNGVVNLKEILNIRSDQDFLNRFAGSPIMRTKREGLLRNACIVAMNTEATSLSKELEILALQDASDVVRHHAGLALEKLG